MPRQRRNSSSPAKRAPAPKQARFVGEYLIDFNATQAAIRAGYSRKTAEQIGHQLLKKTSVAAAIAKRQSEMAAKLEVTAENVVAELAKIGFANMRDYMKVGPDGDPYLDFSALTLEQAAALAEVTVEDFKDGRGEDARDVRRVKFKLHDKRAALVDLGKHLGIFEADNRQKAATLEALVLMAIRPERGNDDAQTPLIEAKTPTEG